MNVELHVLNLSDRGVQCATLASTGTPFWLPKQGVDWGATPAPGEIVTAGIPSWMARHHRQLVGDVAFESAKARHADTRKEQMMTDKPVDAGKGALFKNTKREKPSHPDYRGECEIKGRKFWVSGWIRKSEKSGETYMSLAFREAEEQRTTQQAPAREWQRPPADADIPF